MAETDTEKIHKQYNFCEKCRPIGTFGGCIKCGLLELQALMARLDEAMASPEDIARDTAAVGGYVSGLDLIYGAETVINRAIEIIHMKGLCK